LRASGAAAGDGVSVIDLVEGRDREEREPLRDKVFVPLHVQDVTLGEAVLDSEVVDTQALGMGAHVARSECAAKCTDVREKLVSLHGGFLSPSGLAAAGHDWYD
jgi:hypothetical protein